MNVVDGIANHQADAADEASDAEQVRRADPAPGDIGALAAISRH